MSKNKKRIILADLIIFAIFSMLSFTLPGERNETFWVSYIFGGIAILSQLYVQNRNFDKEASVKSIYFGFPVIYVGFVYVVVQIILSIIFILKAPLVPMQTALIPCVLLLAIAWIGFMATNVMQEEIVRQEVKLEQDVSCMGTLRLKVYQFPGQCEDATAQKALQNLADNFKYSDPVGGEHLKASEEKLENSVAKLESALAAGDLTEIIELCKRTDGLLEERNRLCKQMKPR